MADDLDLEAAKAGEKDLARRDLRYAMLEQFDLQGVDLTGAHVEHARFVGANLVASTLEKANLMNADMSGANLSKIVAPSTVFFQVNLEAAILNGANVSRSHFTGAKLKGADLRNADFRRAHLNDGTDFTDCIVDETTLFDGAQIIRPMARLPAFRFYEVDRGILVRLKDGPKEAEGMAAPAPRDPTRDDVAKRIADLLESLAPMQLPDEASHIPAGMGHNNPPEPTPLDFGTREDLTVALTALAVELQQDELKTETVSVGAEKVERAAYKIASWVARKADLAADECVKQLGKTLADGRVWIGAWMVISGKLAALAEVLVALIPH
jgi:hypothetical protein